MQADLSHLRRTIINTCAKAGEGHIPSALSVLDIVHVLYDGVLNVDPSCPEHPDRDRFVLSKGHGCLALYAVLAQHGFIPNDWLARFCQAGAELLGHPERDVAHGIEATTGSLGHGFPIACGIAAGLKIMGSEARVFCLVGDSEMEEGSCWEAAHLATKHELSNLTVIVDNNGNSPNRLDNAPFVSDLASKFRAFGWFVSRVSGHDHDALRSALSLKSGSMPFCVIADTVKGYGVPEMERNAAAWHHRAPRRGELAA